MERSPFEIKRSDMIILLKKYLGFEVSPRHAFFNSPFCFISTLSMMILLIVVCVTDEFLNPIRKKLKFFVIKMVIANSVESLIGLAENSFNSSNSYFSFLSRLCYIPSIKIK